MRRYTVMLDTRITSATSAAVRYRARPCKEDTRPPLSAPAGTVGQRRSGGEGPRAFFGSSATAPVGREPENGGGSAAELPGSLGGGGDGVEEGGPDARRLEDVEAGGGGAARRGDG